MRTYTLLFCSLIISSTLSAQQFMGSDFFDSYNLGALSTQAEDWDTWPGGFDDIEECSIVDSLSSSPSHSMHIGPENDMVYSPIEWEFLDSLSLNYKLYIPQGSAAYMHFSSDPEGWSSAFSDWLFFNQEGDTPGIMESSSSSVTGPILYPQDEWMQVEINYNGSYGNVHINGVLAALLMNPSGIRSIDFWAPAVSEGYYVDDIEWSTFDLTTGLDDQSMGRLKIKKVLEGEILIESNTDGTFFLHDLLGASIVESYDFRVGESRIELPNGLSSGMYVYSIVSRDGRLLQSDKISY